MDKITQTLKNFFGYVSALLARRKRRKNDKKDDPYIYPHF